MKNYSHYHIDKENKELCEQFELYQTSDRIKEQIIRIINYNDFFIENYKFLFIKKN